MILPTLLLVVFILARHARASGNTVTGLLSSAGMAMAVAYGSLASLTNNNNHNASPATNPNCVYVPGAGFSGFFYTLGWLQSMQEEAASSSATTSAGSQDRHYYCYSAGCLVATALLSEIPPTQLFDLALTTRQKWNNGLLSRFEFVEEFVDQLLQLGKPKRLAKQLDKLVIITSMPTNYGGLKTDVRTPATMEGLAEMLLQTTWIPGVTGNSLSYEGHLDGAFTALSGAHPSCATAVNLPELSLGWNDNSDTMDFFANTLNMNLQLPQFWQFLHLGQDYGKRATASAAGGNASAANSAATVTASSSSSSSTKANSVNQRFALPKKKVLPAFRQS